MAGISPGDVHTASYDLDASGPFIGARFAEGQELEFPRSTVLAGEVAGVVPDRVLDYVALRALQLGSEDEGEPAVVSEKILDRSVTYAHPKSSRTQRLMKSLIRPYRRYTGRIA